MSLYDEIIAGGFDLQNRDDGAIAAALSVGRKKLQHTEIGVGTILAAFGGNGLGGQFLDALESAGQANRDIHWLLQGTILRGVLDVGNAATRAGMQGLAAAMPPFAAGIDALLAMGEVDDVVTAQDVAKALEGK